MNQYQQSLYANLMALCADSEAFYYVDHVARDLLGQEYSFRVFTYRLASYTDFLRPDAIECRGHTFRMKDGFTEMLFLASLPMQKFFNLGENPLTMGLDLSTICKIMDKLDGSLISTVVSRKYESGEVILKSKTSFSSEQARAAMVLLRSEAYRDLYMFCLEATRQHYTVNFEYCAPDNRIVLGYEKPMLKILNIRSNVDGSYVLPEQVHAGLPEHYIVQSHDIPADPVVFIESIAGMEGIEGYIVQLETGQLVKIKTDAYCLLHKTKDSVSTPRKLFEACVYETADDLRSMFANDIGAINLINEMETKVASVYNHLHKVINEFYDTNKHLSRKDYAILGQQELAKDGVFSLAMNLYLGKDSNLKEFMVKNYRNYGIKDEDPTATNLD